MGMTTRDRGKNRKSTVIIELWNHALPPRPIWMSHNQELPEAMMFVFNKLLLYLPHPLHPPIPFPIGFAL